MKRRLTKKATEQPDVKAGISDSTPAGFKPSPTAPERETAAPWPAPAGPRQPVSPKPPSLASFKLPIPSILLEGDEPAPPPKAGPGEKFAGGGEPPHKRAAPATEQLPANYGTGRLNAIARDPYCLFVHWDFTDDQQRYYNSLSADRHLVLRAHYDALSGSMAQEVHLHAETRHWFLHVPRAAAQYFVQIGYYLSDGSWITIRSSGPIITQPDRAAEDQSVRFAYAPPSAPAGEGSRFHDLGTPDRSTPPEFHETIKTPVLPESRPAIPTHQPRWTLAQEEALTELISSLIKKEQVPGSLEILELLQRQVRRQMIPLEEELGLPGPSSAALGISSLPQEQEELPFSIIERLPAGKGFWFNINAELIIYGATEPDARVTIGGRPIKLRPDGSFSYRFALPDGCYELPTAATSSDQSETRRAELRFSRQTAYSGEVGAHPQDQALRTPVAENVA